MGDSKKKKKKKKVALFSLEIFEIPPESYN